jgi:hypothetical protein
MYGWRPRREQNFKAAAESADGPIERVLRWANAVSAKCHASMDSRNG